MNVDSNFLCFGFTGSCFAEGDIGEVDLRVVGYDDAMVTLMAG